MKAKTGGGRMSDTALAPAPNICGELISFEEVAHRLHISRSSIYGLKRKGKLPFRILQPSPGRYFCDSADIDDYLASCWRPAATKENQ